MQELGGTFDRASPNDPNSTGLPTRQGFDFFLGYLDQKQARNVYPTHSCRNEEWYPLRNKYFSPHQKLDGDPNDRKAYDRYRGVDYFIDIMTREVSAWLRGNHSKPFFPYFAPTIPHLALQVPETALKEYEGQFPRRRIPQTSVTSRTVRRARRMRR